MNKKLLGLVGLAFVAALAVEAIARPTNSWNFKTLLLQSDQTLTVQGPANFTGTVSMGSQLSPIPAAQTLAASGIIAADACGGIKQITSATGAISTSATTPLVAAAAGNAGCMMDIVNVGPSAITVKVVAGSFNWAGAADVVLGSSDTFTVGSNGAQWYQFAGTGNN